MRVMLVPGLCYPPHQGLKPPWGQVMRCDFTQDSKVVAHAPHEADLLGSHLGKVELVPAYLPLLPEELLPW